MTLLFLYSSNNKYYRYYYNFWGSSIGYWEKNDEQKTTITHQLYPSLIRIHNNNNSGCYRLLSLSSSSSSFIIIIINEYLLLMLLLCYVWLAVSATLLCVHSLCYVTDIIRLQNVKQEWTELYVSMYLCALYEWEKTSSHLNKMKTITTKNLWAIVIMMKNSLGDYKNFLVFAWQCLFGWILNEICEFGFIKEKTLHKCLSACLSNIWCWHFLVCLFLEIIIKYWIW